MCDVGLVIVATVPEEFDVPTRDRVETPPAVVGFQGRQAPRPVPVEGVAAGQGVEHQLVMVAEDGHQPAMRAEPDQPVEDARRVRAAVDVVAEGHDEVVGRRPDGRDQASRAFEQPWMSPIAMVRPGNEPHFTRRAGTGSAGAVGRRSPSYCRASPGRSSRGLTSAGETARPSMQVPPEGPRPWPFARTGSSTRSRPIRSGSATPATARTLGGSTTSGSRPWSSSPPRSRRCRRRAI